MGDYLEKIGFKDFIIGRAKSQQEIDTQIDRLGDEFQTNESSEESHESGREEYQDADELGGMLPRGENRRRRKRHRFLKSGKGKKQEIHAIGS